MLFKSERWLAPGHNCIVQDEAGDDWIVYHAIDTTRGRETDEDHVNSRRVLMIDRIDWRDGWPRVGTPSDTAQPMPAL
jgi:arabinan endo-1,5-alpha-L-arabinosidase